MHSRYPEALQQEQEPRPWSAIGRSKCCFARCSAAALALRFSRPFCLCTTHQCSVAELAGLREALAPTAEYLNTLGLPAPLVHWGHPGNSEFFCGRDRREGSIL
jgi:hypothetical protein